MADPVIVVRNVIKVYESRSERVTALKDVSLTVEKGKIVTIMGPSGSGKTTLLNLIAGIDKPTAGQVIVDGVEVHKLPEEKLRTYRLHKIGYVFQSYNLVPTLTALENVLLPMTLAGKPDKVRARELIESVGLKGKEAMFPEELSGGEQQRLAIAVALANDPPIIIADEPTGELDLATGEKIMRLLISQRDEHGKTLLITTHDPRVARMTDRVVLLEDGRVRGEYEPTRIPSLAGGLSGEAEVHAERIIAEYLKERLARLQQELERLGEAYRRGEISLEELATRYLQIRSLIEATRAELARLGAGVEA